MLELPVMFNSDDTYALSELGIETKLSASIVRPVFFCIIDSFQPYYEDGKEYTLLRSNGETFVIAYDYATAKKVILTD